MCSGVIHVSRLSRWISSGDGLARRDVLSCYRCRKGGLPSNWKRIHRICRNPCSRALKDGSMVVSDLPVLQLWLSKATETPTSSVPLTSDSLLSRAATTHLALHNNQLHLSHPEEQPSATARKQHIITKPCRSRTLLMFRPLSTKPSTLETLPTSRASIRSRVRDPVLTTAAQLDEALLQGPAKVSSQTSQSAGCRPQLRGEHGRRRRRRKRRVVG